MRMTTFLIMAIVIFTFMYKMQDDCEKTGGRLMKDLYGTYVCIHENGKSKGVTE